MNASPTGPHYGSDRLVERLAAALRAAGLNERPLTARDLAPLDQFHARGLAATVELAAALDPKPDDRVIDIGSGLGGPSRYLAQRYGCHVHGVDLNQAFVEAAIFLAGRAGIADRVEYRRANALDLPFEQGGFDIAWTQHVAMNIADRPRLYAEAFRVLRPGGRLALYDVIARPGQTVIFPVPWARTPDDSFLLTETDMRDTVERAGFVVKTWEDHTPDAIAWFEDLLSARQPDPPPAIGLHLAMGPGWPEMTANLARNLREGRVGLLQAILARP